MIETTEYAKALFMLVEEDEITDNVLESMKGIEKILSDNPEYIKLIDSPAVANADRLKLIDTTFNCVEEPLINFMKIYAKSVRFTLLSIARKSFIRFITLRAA